MSFSHSTVAEYCNKF